jgi:hypothetical protein
MHVHRLLPRFSLAIALLPSSSATIETNRAEFDGRTAHAIVYDEAHRHTIVFGGVSPGPDRYPASTWAWDGTSWSRLATDGPPGREDALLAYDRAHERVILYGGRRLIEGPDRAMRVLTDTWAFDGRRWTQLDSIGPGPREHAAMVYDADGDRIVVFGGWDPVGDAPRRDAWEWKGEQWNRIGIELPRGTDVNGAVDDAATARVLLSVIEPGAGPDDGRIASRMLALANGRIETLETGPRFSPLAPIANRTAASQLLLFAGFEPPPDTLPRTWIREQGRWRSYVGDNPGRRRGAAMTWDARRDRIVLIGGDDGDRILDDVWEWDGGRWQHVH